MSRQSDKIDNTPFWAVDPDRWDLCYKSFHGKEGDVTFDVSREATVQHLLSAIQQRGGRIYIGFEFYDAKHTDLECDIVRLAQFGGNLIHAGVWFGEHVTALAACSRVGVIMVQSPMNFGKWELVSLPFTDIPLAFRIGVDIVLKCSKECIAYNDQRWTVLNHVLKRLLIPGYQAGGTESDYNADKPATWTHGVHCSQLVLLFLKRCVLRNALHIPPQHRDKLLNTNSYTCLPVDLRNLLREIWGGVGEFRDYRDVGSNVRRVWYQHYWERDVTRQL